jgi:hypothetical protein
MDDKEKRSESLEPSGEKKELDAESKVDTVLDAAEQGAREERKQYENLDGQITEDKTSIRDPRSREAVDLEQQVFNTEADGAYAELKTQFDEMRERSGRYGDSPETEESPKAVEETEEKRSVENDSPAGEAKEEEKAAEETPADEATENDTSEDTEEAGPEKVTEDVMEALFNDEEQKAEYEKMKQGFDELDESENKDAKKEAMQSMAANYAAKLGLEENYTLEQLVLRQKAEEAKLGISEEIDQSDFRGKEKEFLGLISEGQEILAEGNPAKIRAYLLEMKVKIDSCGNRLKYIFLQMEADPGREEELKKDFVSIISAIDYFEKASREIDSILRDLDEAERLTKKGNLNPEEQRKLEETKSRFAEWLKFLAKGLVFLTAIAYIAEKVSEAVAAHPTLAGLGGIGGIGAGMCKLGAFTGMGVSSAAAAETLFKIWVIKSFLWDEKKRDDAVERIFAIKLPAWAKAPAKKKAEEKK